MLTRALLCLIAGVVVSGCATATSAEPATLDPQGMRQFITRMSGKYGFSDTELQALFAQARLMPAILDAVARPAESKPWFQYRALFITPERIDAGVSFWKNNAATLERAKERYGVEPETIVAIMGVETFYGRNKGGYRVLDALSTLAFNYAKRGEFFGSELEQYLLLTRDQHIDPLSLTGSYAGAMGLPQFMPSSYRHYAVDFDDDGHIDIWNDAADAIGSVACYLSEHGWRSGRPVAMRATVRGEDYPRLVAAGVRPSVEARRLQQSGVTPETTLAGDTLVALLEFETAAGHEYWVGFDNFYTITRYNQSPLYAMAVYQLSTAIRDDYYGRQPVTAW